MDDLLLDDPLPTTLVGTPTTSESGAALIGKHSASAPPPLLEGDDRVPDFEALAEPLRPKFEAVKKLDLNGMRARLEALAETRTFLRAAREFPAEFRRLSRSRHAISGKGRIETVVLRWFFARTDKGWTGINRAADILAWMTYQYQGESPAADLVETVLREGYVEVANRFRQTQTSLKPEPAPLIEEAEDTLENHAPADATWLFERVPDNSKTEIDLMYVVQRPGALPQLYPVQRDEKLIRAARRLLR
jgi:hypothetical protein